MFYFNPTIRKGSFSTISTDAFENMSGLSHFKALNDGFWRSCPETSHWLPLPHQNLFTTRTSTSHQFGCPFCLLSRKSFQLAGTLVSTRDFKCTLMLSYINTPALQQMTTPHISGSHTEADIRITRRVCETTEYFALSLEFLSQFV